MMVNQLDQNTIEKKNQQGYLQNNSFLQFYRLTCELLSLTPSQLDMNITFTVMTALNPAEQKFRVLTLEDPLCAKNDNNYMKSEPKSIHTTLKCLS